MAYSTELAKTLTDQLTKFTTLNRHQLVGQAANLDFWTAEVQHCLDVIDGYSRRFERLKAAQESHVAERRTVEFSLHDPCCTQQSAAPPKRVPHKELGEARRRLCEATYRFFVRCFNEGLLEETALRRWCDQLGIGIETRDLRRST